jgi:hypothetical protein
MTLNLSPATHRDFIVNEAAVPVFHTHNHVTRRNEKAVPPSNNGLRTELMLGQVLRVLSPFLVSSGSAHRHNTIAAVRSGKAVRMHVGVVPVMLQRYVSLIDGS